MPRYYDVSNGFTQVSTPQQPSGNSGSSGQSQSGGMRTMSQDTFKKYQKSFNQWKRTGSYGDTSWTGACRIPLAVRLVSEGTLHGRGNTMD